MNFSVLDNFPVNHVVLTKSYRRDKKILAQSNLTKVTEQLRGTHAGLTHPSVRTAHMPSAEVLPGLSPARESRSCSPLGRKALVLQWMVKMVTTQKQEYSVENVSSIRSF